jgi:hypothetical protein
MANQKHYRVLKTVGLAIAILVFTSLVCTGSAAALSNSYSGATYFAQTTTPPTNPTGTTAGNGPPPITIPNPKASACPKGACIINDYINPAIKALTATAGVIAVISLIIAGIQYSSAGGDPSKIGAAKSRIGKTIGAFLFFIFLYVFLNYIVPGGV